MVIPVNRDGMAAWQQLRQQEQETGEIPLPAVDSIAFHENGNVVISVIDPSAVPGCTTFFVNTNALGELDKLRLATLLKDIQDEAPRMGVEGTLRFVLHAGGLDYDFTGTNTVALSDLDVNVWSSTWELLHLVATIGRRYPDVEASRPKRV